jgi:hypothetical protein
MSVNYIPFESKSGFRSPNFSVNEKGDLSIGGQFLLNGDFSTTGVFRVNGIELVQGVDSTPALGDDILHSSLRTVGILDYLTVDGNVIVKNGPTNIYFTIVNGQVDIASKGGIGSIDNMTIGLVTPQAAAFTDVSVTGTVTGNLPVTGIVSSGVAPTSAAHLTRKDYVDKNISAFAIAFGA